MAIAFAAAVFKDQANVKIISANDTDDDYIRIAKESSDDDTLVVGCKADGWKEDIGPTGDKFRTLMSEYCGGEWRRIIGYAAPICAFAVKRFADCDPTNPSVGCTAGCGVGPTTDYVTVNFYNKDNNNIDPTTGKPKVLDSTYSTLGHEMGHACNLWHEEDSSNLMHGSYTLLTTNPNQRRELTRWQKASIRASRHVTFF